MNARPLVPVSNDPDVPTVLTPAQKTNTLTVPIGNFSTTDFPTKQWKQVQCLADTFWKSWKREYLVPLEHCGKWTDDKPNISVGDVVLLKAIKLTEMIGMWDIF